MTSFNLLPDAYRKQASHSGRHLLIIGAAVATNAALLAWAGWLAFGSLPRVYSDVAAQRSALQSLEPALSRHSLLATNLRAAEALGTRIEGLRAERTLWSDRLDQLISIVDEGSRSGAFEIWFDSIDFEAGRSVRGARRAASGHFRASGHSASDDFGDVADFLDAVDNSTLRTGFTSPSPPEGTRGIPQDGLEPAVVWDFPLELEWTGAGREGQR